MHMSATRTIPAKFTISGGDPVAITVAAAADGKATSPRFDMVLNSGQPFDGFGFPCILDMAGGKLPAEGKMPILRQHRGDLLAGQSDRVTVENGALRVAGDVYPDLASGAEILAANARGFRWQASYGIKNTAEVEWVEADKPVVVNGQPFKDGLWIKKWELAEGSFVPIGADAKTSAFVVAAPGGDVPRITIPNRRSKTNMADPVPATCAQLLEVYSDAEDQGFVIAQLSASATLEQAASAYNTVLKDRLKAAKAAPAPTLTPAAPAKAPRLPVSTASAGNPAPVQASARDQFMAIVEAEKAKGKDCFEARIAASGEDIRLDHAERARRRAIHAAYVSEANGLTGENAWKPMTLSAR